MLDFDFTPARVSLALIGGDGLAEQLAGHDVMQGFLARGGKHRVVRRLAAGNVGGMEAGVNRAELSAHFIFCLLDVKKCQPREVRSPINIVPNSIGQPIPEGSQTAKIYRENAH